MANHIQLVRYCEHETEYFIVTEIIIDKQDLQTIIDAVKYQHTFQRAFAPDSDRAKQQAGLLKSLKNLKDSKCPQISYWEGWDVDPGCGRDK